MNRASAQHSAAACDQVLHSQVRQQSQAAEAARDGADEGVVAKFTERESRMKGVSA
jgi:hypothetical protein